MDPAQAALAALTEEGRSGLPYRWPNRSCVSLIRALCRHLGTPEPAYGPWEAMSEREAALKAVKGYTSMGTGHQAGLVATGRWRRVETKDADGRTVAPRAGDVVSWTGEVLAANDEVYTPPAAGFEATGICGVHGIRWIWTQQGLCHVAAGTIGFITRSVPCP